MHFNPGLKLGGRHEGIGKCHFFAILSALVLVTVCLDMVRVNDVYDEHVDVHFVLF